MDKYNVHIQIWRQNCIGELELFFYFILKETKEGLVRIKTHEFWFL